MVFEEHPCTPAPFSNANGQGPPLFPSFPRSPPPLKAKTELFLDESTLDTTRIMLPSFDGSHQSSLGFEESSPQLRDSDDAWSGLWLQPPKPSHDQIASRFCEVSTCPELSSLDDEDDSMDMSEDSVAEDSASPDHLPQGPVLVADDCMFGDDDFSRIPSVRLQPRFSCPESAEIALKMLRSRRQAW